MLYVPTLWDNLKFLIIMYNMVCLDTNILIPRIVFFLKIILTNVGPPQVVRIPGIPVIDAIEYVGVCFLLFVDLLRFYK